MACPQPSSSTAMPNESPPRGAKHGRAASTVSRDAKRVRDDVSVMSVEPEFAPATQEGNNTNTRTRKRVSDDDDEEATALSSVADEDESTTELGNDDDRRTTGKSTRTADENDDDEAWLARQQAQPSSRKGKAKVARTTNVDSPSQGKRRVKRGAKDPFITSPPGAKARGKRAVDESDDHQIGEEWTDLNGLRWRMGEDGEVRREAVVQEMRLKYPNMPKDSRHPDAKLKVPVLVERFLTESEYEEKRAAKLLGFQEEERQRDIDEAVAKLRRDQEQLEEERRKLIAESGRPITTPKKLRNVDALFASSPARQHSPASARSSPVVPYKRLSISMGNVRSTGDEKQKDDDNASKASTSKAAEPPSTPKPSTKTPMSAPSSASKRVGATPRRQPPTSAQSPSLRAPLASPSPSSKRSPDRTAATEPNNPTADAGAAPSTLQRVLGSLSSIVTRRNKREESLLRLVRDEADRRKDREASSAVK